MRSIPVVALVLALQIALPARGSSVFAPAIKVLPQECRAITLHPHEAGRSADMVLQEEDVTVTLIGPVASMTVRQAYRYDSHWFSPGDEAVHWIRTSHLAALYDYWITENGKVHPGIVRDQASAAAEYSSIVASRKDPGLAEWMQEGQYRLRLYPVLEGGIRKDQGFKLLQVLPVGSGGEVTLTYTLPVYRVERTRWHLRLPDGVKVKELVSTVPFSETAGGFEGQLSHLPAGEKTITLTLTTTTAALHQPSFTWLSAGSDFLQVSPCASSTSLQPQFRAYLGPVSTIRELAAVSGLPVGPAAADPAADPEIIPQDSMDRLFAVARGLRLRLDDARPLEALQVFRNIQTVGPEVVLFANPFATDENVEKGWKKAAFGALCDQVNARTGGTGNRPQAPSFRIPSISLDFSLPGGVLAPDFRCARERANTRACFANQKTIAGALEMYLLDKGWDRFERLMANGSMRLPHEKRAPVAFAPPPGVEWGYWRNQSQFFAIQQNANTSGTSPLDLLPADLARPVPVELLQELVNEGYLQCIPHDPGAGGSAKDHYCLVGWGNRIFCLCHGEIQSELSYDHSARDQLEHRGVTDKRLLSRASTLSLNEISNRQRSWQGSGWALLLSILSLACAVLVQPHLWSMKTSEQLCHTLNRWTWLFAKSGLWCLPALLLGPLVIVPLGFMAGYAGFILGGLVYRTFRGWHYWIDLDED